MKIHEKYIKRCIQIAKNGLGSTAPNPMVGCVIVHNNSIIGEGFTSPYGGAHAEVNAINSVLNKSLLKQSTLYVTLEPCSHIGKTPPCSDLIIKHHIPKVVIGCQDSNPKVAGEGISKLKASGCDVTVGSLEANCRAHHKRFFTFHEKKRPYIILKWAETKDGFIAPEHKLDQKPVWITNTSSRKLVHKWRAEEQAILIGYNTAVQDNPQLTTRDWKGKNPIRIVLDKDEKLGKDLSVYNDEAETLLLKENTAEGICKSLYAYKINSVIVEGGAKTLQRFVDANLWDEARVFVGPTFFEAGVKAPTISGQLISTQQLKDDTLNIYYND